MSSTQRANRPKRVPLGRRNRLAVDGRPGLVPRWFNDIDDRLERAKAAGYTHVLDSVTVGEPRAGDASQMGKPVAKKVGGGVTAYLMEIPEGFYREDQAAKQLEVDAREAGLRPNTNEGQYGGMKLRQTKSKTKVAEEVIGDDPGA